MNGQMKGSLPGAVNGRTDGRLRARQRLSIVLPVACVCLGGVACLTPGQTRSVGEQLGEIRQQTRQVRQEQQRNAASIGTIVPVGEPASGAPSEERRELHGVRTRPAGGSPAVAAADRDGGPDRTAISPASYDEGLFRDGYALYHRRDYQGAEQLLRRFLAADPHGPMADNALFWIGECRFARGLYRDAILEYRAVIDRYPDSHRVPRAWYMIALSYERLEEPAAMKDHLAIVVEEFPESDVAPLARDRLGNL